jgi:hypothetical protein
MAGMLTKKHPLVLATLVFACLGLVMALDLYDHTKPVPDHLAAMTMPALSGQYEAIAKAERSELDRQYARSPQGIEATRQQL